MTSSIETVLACPDHGPRFKIARRQESEQVFVHEPQKMDGTPVDAAKECDICGGGLIREEPSDA